MDNSFIPLSLKRVSSRHGLVAFKLRLGTRRQSSIALSFGIFPKSNRLIPNPLRACLVGGALLTLHIQSFQTSLDRVALTMRITGTRFGICTLPTLVVYTTFQHHNLHLELILIELSNTKPFPGRMSLRGQGSYLHFSSGKLLVRCISLRGQGSNLHVISGKLMVLCRQLVPKTICNRTRFL